MNNSSSEPLNTKGSWSPFMCPSCRGLFRAPADKTGKTQCPLCESAIRVEPPVEPTFPDDETVQASPKRQKKKKLKSKSRAQSWEEEASQSKKDGASKGLIFTALFFISVVLGASIMLLLQEKKLRFNSPTKETALSKEAHNGNSPFGDSFFDLTTEPKAKFNTPLLELESSDLQIAQEAAQTFLNCQNIEEFAPLIRDPERVMPLIKEYYRKTPYQPIGVISVDENGVAQVAKRFASFEVVLKDYSSKPIAVELTDGKALVDWESWVGYCPIPWETFIEKKVTTPSEVRVNVKRAFYYNFSFRDDSQWVCYRLRRSTDDSIIYGYAPRDANFVKSLPGSRDPEATFVLKIRFPDNPVSSNQVIISDFLQSGWVLGL